MVDIPSGYVKIAIENGHRKFVSFPSKHGDFSTIISLPEGKFWDRLKLCGFLGCYPAMSRYRHHWGGDHLLQARRWHVGEEDDNAGGVLGAGTDDISEEVTHPWSTSHSNCKEKNIMT